MSGSWNHGKAYYRCKFPTDYPEPAPAHPRTVYVREASRARQNEDQTTALFPRGEHAPSHVASFTLAAELAVERLRLAHRRFEACDLSSRCPRRSGAPSR